MDEPETVQSEDQPTDEQLPDQGAVETAEPQAEPEAVVDEGEEVPEVSWQASEYTHHDKSMMWYVGLVAVTVVLVGVAALTKQWFSIPVFVVMAIAVVVYASKKPQVLSYHIGEDGIAVGNKTYRFSQFRSFAVIDLAGVLSVDLDPTERFQPRLSLMLAEDNLDAVVDALSVELPIEQRSPDLVERFSRYIKF